MKVGAVNGDNGPRAIAGRFVIPVCLAVLSASIVGGCDQKNAYAPPPPPDVGVAQPVVRMVTPYIDATGTTVAYNSVDLQARVQGFVQEISFRDGDKVAAGQSLFLIEPDPYTAKVEQADAALSAAQAQFEQSDVEYNRQASMGQRDVVSRSSVDQARATRDSNAANVKSQEAALKLAKINLGYTQVTAPFAGVVTSHLVSVGALVGVTGPTTLASVVQLDPIYVSFSLSEQDVQRVRTMLRNAGVTASASNSATVEVGLMAEEGYPHTGAIDYISPKIDSSTGTLALRAVLKNTDVAMLPGYFVRIRIPTASLATQSLLVPDAALGTNQAGRYLLVVNADDVVEMRTVVAGQMDDNLRVVTGQLNPGDRVVISGLSRVVPGEKVAPKPVPMPGS